MAISSINSDTSTQKLIDSCISPLIGLEYIEYFLSINNNLGYKCTLCINSNFSQNEFLDHIMSLNHRLLYLKKNYLDIYDGCLKDVNKENYTKDLTIRVESAADFIEKKYGRKNVGLTINKEYPLIKNDETHKIAEAAKLWADMMIKINENIPIPPDILPDKRASENMKFNMSLEYNKSNGTSNYLTDEKEVFIDVQPFIQETLQLITEPLLGMEFVIEHQFYKSCKLLYTTYTCNLCDSQKTLSYGSPNDNILNHLLCNEHKRAFLATKDTALLRQWDLNLNSNDPFQANKSLSTELLKSMGGIATMGVTINGIYPDLFKHLLQKSNGSYMELVNHTNEKELTNYHKPRNNFKVNNSKPYDTKKRVHASSHPKPINNDDANVSEIVSMQVEVVRIIKGYVDWQIRNEDEALITYPTMDNHKWQLLDCYVDTLSKSIAQTC
ncbi:uncharacterized protein LOC135924599 isoform X2 [Gordionus sp. m RMFG-2023]